MNIKEQKEWIRAGLKGGTLSGERLTKALKKYWDNQEKEEHKEKVNAAKDIFK